MHAYGRPFTVSEALLIGGLIEEPMIEKYRRQICTARELGPHATFADYLFACHEIQGIPTHSRGEDQMSFSTGVTERDNLILRAIQTATACHDPITVESLSGGHLPQDFDLDHGELVGILSNMEPVPEPVPERHGKPMIDRFPDGRPFVVSPEPLKKIEAHMQARRRSRTKMRRRLRQSPCRPANTSSPTRSRNASCRRSQSTKRGLRST